MAWCCRARSADENMQRKKSKIEVDVCSDNEWIGNMNGILTCEPKPAPEGGAGEGAGEDAGDDSLGDPPDSS